MRLDWNTILPSGQCSYVLGNPPFIGKKARNREQVEDMEHVFGKLKAAGNLDYVTCWYKRAAEYVRGTGVSVAFVSTSSITQGEQPGILWPELFQECNLKIHFAYRTFPWESEARGKAHVHVVIIGFGAFDIKSKHIYEMAGNETVSSEVRNISPYLIEDDDRVLSSRKTPISDVPEMMFGNMPNDGGNLLLTGEEKQNLIRACPGAEQFVRPFISAKEYLHSEERWCIWLNGVSPHLYSRLPQIMDRVAAVKAFRENSKREATKQLAALPSLFGEIRQPDTDYILISCHSSESRKFVPMSYFSAESIVGNSCLFIADATLYHFGILASTMHMAWMRQVCGRIKSDYRYSAGLVYNNFPWPRLNLPMQDGDARVRESASRIYWSSYHESWEDEDGVRQQPEPPSVRLTGDARKMAAVEARAKAVLDVRARYPLATLAELYDPLTMPPDLVKAHADLDRAVDRCYRTAPFTSERQRVEFLFALYESYTAPLLPATKTRRKRSKVRAASTPSRKI